jgi:DNA-binding NarL/FixJ family response regulator
MTAERNSPIILAVDDSPDSLGLLNSALNQAGYMVLVALNGEQALTIVEQIKPDAVLMDALMPGMDGFACCRRMRRLLPLTPIIFMTGLTEVEHLLSAFDSGGDDYITKPIQPEELLARITAHVSRARLIDNARAALDMARQFVLAVQDDGRMLWATPETEELLARHGIDLGNAPDSIAERLRPWIAEADKRSDLSLKTPGASLTLRYFKRIDHNEHLLRVVGQNILTDPSLLEAALPLTKREAEVLLWVAHGKTNREIGDLLSLSPRTVNKHLEQIYPKIQVDNRAAATSIAIQALLGLPV